LLIAEERFATKRHREVEHRSHQAKPVNHRTQNFPAPAEKWGEYNEEATILKHGKIKPSKLSIDDFIEGLILFCMIIASIAHKKIRCKPRKGKAEGE
jgi:hypothetical protein